RTLRTPFTAPGHRALVSALEASFADPLWPTYVFGNHDRPRADPARARLRAAFQLTVRVVPFIYYGEELGLPGDSGLDVAQAPLAARYRFVPRFLHPALRRRGLLLNRDESRSPMPWNGGPGAGFSPPGARAPWLRLHPRSAEINVATQRDDPSSVLATYR